MSARNFPLGLQRLQFIDLPCGTQHQGVAGWRRIAAARDTHAVARTLSLGERARGFAGQKSAVPIACMTKDFAAADCKSSQFFLNLPWLCGTKCKLLTLACAGNFLSLLKISADRLFSLVNIQGTSPPYVLDIRCAPTPDARQINSLNHLF